MNPIETYKRMMILLPDIILGLEKIQNGEPMTEQELFKMKLKYEELHTLVH